VAAQVASQVQKQVERQMAVFKENYKAEMQEKLQKLVKEGVAKQLEKQGGLPSGVQSASSAVQRGRIPSAIINGKQAMSPRSTKNFIQANKSKAQLNVRSPVRGGGSPLDMNKTNGKSFNANNMMRSSSKGALMKNYKPKFEA
jgi:hypothetical protein